MSSPYEQCVTALDRVLAFYARHGCPCGFPRFGQLAQIHFRNYTNSPVGCHATEIAIAKATGENGFYQFVRDGGDVRQLACWVCGSEVETRWEQFSINMDVTAMVYRIVRAQPVGLMVEPVIPMPRGFFGFDRASIDVCAKGFTREGSFDDMIAYLQALREA